MYAVQKQYLRKEACNIKHKRIQHVTTVNRERYESKVRKEM